MSIFPDVDAMTWRWVWLAVASFLGGTLNAVAGGGSFLVFPALLGMKMLPIQANATNTVALWPGQLTSIAAYRNDLKRNLRLALPIVNLEPGGLGRRLHRNADDFGFRHRRNDNRMDFTRVSAHGLYVVGGGPGKIAVPVPATLVLSRLGVEFAAFFPVGIHRLRY